MLGEEELVALGFEATQKEVCAELEGIGGLVFEDFAIEGGYLVGVVGRERH
jgi:hypothetical protein